MRIWPGKPYPLGAHWDGRGTNFALFSQHATAVDLCLFDSPDDPKERERIRLDQRTDFVWHCYLPEVHPGTAYGYRVDGEWAPGRGHRFDPTKLLVDPYALALHGDLRFDDALFSRPGGPEPAQDSAAFVPRSIVMQ